MSFIAPIRLRPTSRFIGICAIRALYRELILYPKPGLVSPIDQGAHRDMNVSHFWRSLFALRGYFGTIAEAGARDAPFTELQKLGLAAENRMMRATGGVNTHRGAIFSLGLLAAAAGRRAQSGRTLDAAAIAGDIALRWGEAIALAGAGAAGKGARAAQQYGVRDARGEALAGFPSAVGVALPILRQRGPADERALVQALFAIMADLDDNNILHRGGPLGLEWLRSQARGFLAQGGVDHPEWRARALALHRACVARHLSPGGAADQLAAALFLASLTE